MARTPEGEQKDQVKKFLTSIQAYQHWPVPSGYGRQGIDCYACIKRIFWAIEVKRDENEEPTPRQWQTLEEVRVAEGLTAVGTADKIIKTITYVMLSHGYDFRSKA